MGTSIVLSNLAIPTSSLSIAGDGLAVSGSSMGASVTLNWSYRENSWPHVSDSGSADVSISGTTFAVNLAVGEADGEPTVSVTSNSCTIGSLSIKLHGGASWLYNLFVSVFSGQIKSSVESALNAAVKSAIDVQAAAALKTLPIEEKVDSISSFNFELTAAPVYDSAYISTAHYGAFIANVNPTPTPWAPVALPNADGSNEIQLILSEAVAISAAYVYQQAGYLSANLTQGPDWPSYAPALNTSTFKLFIPALYDAYPNEAMMFGLACNSTPVVAINTTGLYANFEGTLDAYVIEPNKTEVYAFTLGLQVYTSGNVSMRANNVTGSMACLYTAISLDKTAIGSFDVSLLQALVDVLVSKAVLPHLNTLIGYGFPIPVVDGIGIADAKFSYYDGYVVIGADLSYNPKPLLIALGLADAVDLDDAADVRIV